MKDKVNAPIVVGAVVGLVVVIALIGWYFLKGPDTSGISAANAPAYAKKDAGAVNYGETYKQNPGSSKPPMQSPPSNP